MHLALLRLQLGIGYGQDLVRFRVRVKVMVKVRVKVRVSPHQVLTRVGNDQARAKKRALVRARLG